MTVDKKIVEKDKNELINSINLANSVFASVIMSFLAKYQVLSDKDILTLTSKEQCRVLFQSDYPMLKVINPDLDIRSQVIDNNNHSRFYSEVYNINDKQYVMTSQLYGLSTSGTHRNNRTPFYNWILSKFGIMDIWSPTLEEFDPRLSKDDWLELLKNPSVFNENSLYVLASIYDIGGAATCSELNEKYGKTPGLLD